MDKILTIFLWFLFVAGVVITIREWQYFKTNISKIIPYWLIGIVLIFITSALYIPQNVTLADNLVSITTDVILITRNTFMAIVGLTLFNMVGSLKPLRSWEEGLKFLKDIPLVFLLSVIIGFVFYTVIWFYIFVPSVFHNKLVGFYLVLTSLSVNTLIALNEELLFRMFFIGFTIYLFRKQKYNWTIGVIISSIIWSFSHWYVADLGWIKFFHVFPLGIILGYTLKKYGFETCVFLHIVINVVNVLTGQIL
jgi:membrane protease YdiL (CAAX protease family)